MMKVAILGFGFMGKKHFDVLKSNPNFEVSAIIDYQLTNYPKIEHFQSLDSFLEEQPNIDLVVIATPNFEHFNAAKQLLENGYSIFLEKPYCFNSEEAEALQQISINHHRKIFLSNQNRYSPISKFLKTIIDENALGKIYMLQSNLFWSRGENYYLPNSWKGKKTTDGGTLYTQFFHFIDLILWIFGDFEIKNAIGKTFRNAVEIEDTGTFNFELKTGGIGVVNFSTAVFEKNLESSMTIIGEKGTIKISGQYFDEIEYCNIQDFTLEHFNVGKADNLINLNENFNHIFNEYSNESMKQSFKSVQKIEEIYKKLN